MCILLIKKHWYGIFKNHLLITACSRVRVYFFWKHSLPIHVHIRVMVLVRQWQQHSILLACKLDGHQLIQAFWGQFLAIKHSAYPYKYSLYK